MTPTGDAHDRRIVQTFGGQPRLPAELVSALAASARARERFDLLEPRQQREYATWIAQARRADARERRAAQAVMRLLEQADC